jgi:hypothetical protein
MPALRPVLVLRATSYPHHARAANESGRMARAEAVDLAAFLLGTWRLEREIVDWSARAQSGHVTGWATFTPDAEAPGLLRYVERGTVQLGSHRGPAVRRLGYDVDGPRARVVFDDGRFFHDLDLRAGVWEVGHPCRADHYRGRFEVDGAHRWRQEWSVTGPHKHHRIRTVLERATCEPPGTAEARR